jgi:hypothetical protein
MSPAFAWRTILALTPILLGACDGRLAGGHDDVDNPAISVSILDTAGNAYGAAEINLYARYQNPFNDSLPLLSIPSSGDPVNVPDTLVQSAFARAQTRGTPSPAADTLEFNLIARAPGGEAYLGGYALIRYFSGWGFIRRTEGFIIYGDAKGVLASGVRLSAPILGQRGQIGPKGMELGLKRVFVPGSPYAAILSADGSFTFGHIAIGRYELKAIAADEKVYTAADSLVPGSDYTSSDWSEADVIWVSP